jgi:death on curing protein
VEAVKAIHAELLAAHGGSAGVREEALLESAVAAPQATMMGETLFTDPLEIAAAYLFYLCRNHPFVDGNKRTALATCLVFSARTDCCLTRDSMQTPRRPASDLNEAQIQVR